MIDSIYLAWRYLNYNKLKTGILIFCVTVICGLPLTLEILLAETERQLVHRAETSPLLVGAKGSALSLVMNSLYYSDEVVETFTMEAVENIMDTGLAIPIPLYIRFKARGFPIVGTTLDYFDFRGLETEQGSLFSFLGQCVIGSEVARRLGLKPGDSLVSSPETLFDIGGTYPLKMKIAGVFKETHSADDMAVFVDIKTAWVIQGLGHGHQDVTTTSDRSVILKRQGKNVTANAKLMQYAEINEENIDSFHLHGDPEGFPVSAVLAVPYDSKGGTILQGRYLDKDSLYQITTPKEVVADLMKNIFKMRNVMDAVIILVGAATVMAMVLVFSMSLRLREKEAEVIFKIGCSRLTIARLFGTELLLITTISGMIIFGLMQVIFHFDQSLVRTLVI